ncbi:hypothetical protein ROZALSC1DRAFT_31520 [Rozella allomycis CSF55]|uniref:Uncharacterized protein n=1 Tax=Rozella allomycis (strain CSF55) TaxID=988480 RepID=A0A075B394_ROZAC|nr:hypothetical protein O9G_004464 [Rozella allomycis CSF55]RKP16566.1 hypothetical protein ROZALSC1DRAFT_31520 [Rozella allomycis CSF55]|eukprot:EPZ37053.1 hypothetical protein O9G_004464 [Rozella allomycis CSF55]
MLVPGNFYVFAPLYDDEVNEEFYDVISRQNCKDYHFLEIVGDDLDPRSGLCVVKGYDQLTNLAEVFVSHFADNVIQPNRFVPYGRSARLEGQPLPLEVRPINYFNELSEYINFTNPQRFHVSLSKDMVAVLNKDITSKTVSWQIVKQKEHHQMVSVKDVVLLDQLNHDYWINDPEKVLRARNAVTYEAMKLHGESFSALIRDLVQADMQDYALEIGQGMPLTLFIPVASNIN